MPLGGRLDTFGHTFKRLPEHRACLECSASIFACQSNEGVRASSSSRLGICQSKDVGDCIASVRVSKAKGAIRHPSRQELTRKCSDDGGAELRIAVGVDRRFRGQIRNGVVMTVVGVMRVWARTGL